MVKGSAASSPAAPALLRFSYAPTRSRRCPLGNLLAKFLSDMANLGCLLVLLLPKDLAEA